MKKAFPLLLILLGIYILTFIPSTDSQGMKLLYALGGIAAIASSIYGMYQNKKQI